MPPRSELTMHEGEASDGVMADGGMFHHEQLELTSEQTLALAGLAAFANVLHTGLLYDQTAQTMSLATQGFLAAAQRVSSALPKCPYAPPGKDINTTFDSNFNMHLQCDHAATEGGPHCWSYPNRTVLQPCP